MKYFWDPEFHLFRLETVQEFPYSDGAEVESRLLKVVQSASDRGTFSRDLAKAITDWPSEYHLSAGRHTLLRPLGISQRDRVLELGCGCGAITRYLGEIGAEVVAVEASLTRARIAAERCRDLANVRVFVDDLAKFEIQEQFDYVLLIGVLEYAQLFGGDDAFAHQLRLAKTCLVPSGKLVVAIENKFGLKYFNGCAEDHVGVSYFGLQNLYGSTTARTFGRRELLNLVASAGFPYSRLYFPFPDYKLPSVILTEEALEMPGFNASDLLARSHARDYSGSKLRAFDEALVVTALESEGLLPDLSNSFLLVAGNSQQTRQEPQALASAYSMSRAPQFATETTFVAKGSEFEVVKRHLCPTLNLAPLRAGKMSFAHRVGASEYVPGRQLLWKVLKARASSAGLDPVIRALQPWLKFLLDKAVVISDSDVTALRSYVVPGDMADCTPFNLMETARGLVLIDFEWYSERPISLGWVLTRGLLHTLCTGTPADSGPHSLMEVMLPLCQAAGLSVHAGEVSDWLKVESVFQAEACGRPCYEISLDAVTDRYRSFGSEIATLRREVDRLGAATAAQHEAISNLERQTVEREQRIREASRESSRSERELAIKDLEIQQSQRELIAANTRLKSIEDSAIWRSTAFLRDPSPTQPAALRWMRRMMRATLWTVTLQLPSKLAARRQLFRNCQLVRQSELFDPNWYATRYPDVMQAGWDPALHYVLFGASENRNPGPGFDSGRYLLEYQDVASAGLNPLVHYLRWGRGEGRCAWAVSEKEPT